MITAKLVRSARSRRTGLAALFAAAALTACTDAAGYDLDYLWEHLPFLSTMRQTVAYRPYELPRLPPEGTVPVSAPIGEILPHFTQAALDSVEAVLTNPVPASPQVLARGEVIWEQQCAVCHGDQGEGNGPVVGAGRFPLGPPVDAGPIVARGDGYYYGLIRVGRGLMPAYGERITHADRWAVVHYMRQLQGGAP